MSEATPHQKAFFTLTPFLIFGGVLFVFALIVRAPAGIVQKLLPASASTHVAAWGGTLWRGQALVTEKNAPILVEWQLQPLKLLTGKLVATVQSQGALPLSGELSLGVGRWQVRHLQGDLPSAFIQPFLPAGWELPGNVQVEGLQLAQNGFKKGAWQQGQGQLRWQGGPMQFGFNGQAQQAVLPPLRVEVSLEKQDLMLTLKESSGTLADLRLQSDGQVETRLRERLLRYSPAYRSSGNPPDAVVVTAKQEL